MCTLNVHSKRICFLPIGPNAKNSLAYSCCCCPTAHATTAAAAGLLASLATPASAPTAPTVLLNLLLHEADDLLPEGAVKVKQRQLLVVGNRVSERRPGDGLPLHLWPNENEHCQLQGQQGLRVAGRGAGVALGEEVLDCLGDRWPRLECTTCGRRGGRGLGRACGAKHGSEGVRVRAGV